MIKTDVPQELKPAWLETERGDAIPLQGLCSIGRETSNHLVLGTGAVSRHHALIHERDGEYWVVDLGSVNGSYVNGTRIIQPVRLLAGDRIQIPSALFTFQQGIKAAVSAPRADVPQEPPAIVLPKADPTALPTVTEAAPLSSVAKPAAVVVQSKSKKDSPQLTVAIPVLVVGPSRIKKEPPELLITRPVGGAHASVAKSKLPELFVAKPAVVAAQPKAKPVEFILAKPVTVISPSESKLVPPELIVAKPAVVAAQPKAKPVEFILAKPVTVISPSDSKLVPPEVLVAKPAVVVAQPKPKPPEFILAKPVSVISPSDSKLVPPELLVAKPAVVAAQPKPKPVDFILAKPVAAISPSETRLVPPELIAAKPVAPVAQSKRKAQQNKIKSEPVIVQRGDINPAQKNPFAESKSLAVKPVEMKETPAPTVAKAPLPVAPPPVESKSELKAAIKPEPVIAPNEVRKTIPALPVAPSALLVAKPDPKKKPDESSAAAEENPKNREKTRSIPLTRGAVTDTFNPKTLCSLALRSMYLGLASIFFPFVGAIFAVAAIVLGHRALRMIAQSNGTLTGRGYAIRGLYFGYITLAIILTYSGFFYYLYSSPSSQAALTSASTASNFTPLIVVPGNHNAFSSPVPAVVPNSQSAQSLAPALILSSPTLEPSTPPPSTGQSSHTSQNLTPSVVIPNVPTFPSAPSPTVSAKYPDTGNPPSSATIPAAHDILSIQPEEKAPPTPKNIPSLTTMMESEKNELNAPNADAAKSTTTTAEKPSAGFSYELQSRLKDEMLAIPMPSEGLESSTYMDAEAFNNSARILARKPEAKYAESVQEFLEAVKARNPNQMRVVILSAMYQNYLEALQSP